MNDLRVIYLTRGYIAFVDPDDFDVVIQHKWTYDHGYARRSTGGRKHQRKVYLHRQIAQAPTGVHVDHINRCGMDNRKDNLRFCCQAQNSRNEGVRKNNTSGYKGVHWNKTKRAWDAKISVQGKTKYIGRFSTAIEAARAYDSAAQHYSGTFAYLNGV